MPTSSATHATPLAVTDLGTGGLRVVQRFRYELEERFGSVT